MFHTSAINGSSYDAVRAGRQSQPGGASGPAQLARFLRPDKNTFLWAQERVAWPQLKTFHGEVVYSHFGRRLLCLTCSL